MEILNQIASVLGIIVCVFIVKYILEKLNIENFDSSYSQDPLDIYWTGQNPQNQNQCDQNSCQSKINSTSGYYDSSSFIECIGCPPTTGNNQPQNPQIPQIPQIPQNQNPQNQNPQIQNPASNPIDLNNLVPSPIQCNTSLCQTKIDELISRGISYDTTKISECTACPLVHYTDPKVRAVLQQQSKTTPVIIVTVPYISSNYTVVDQMSHTFQYVVGKSTQGILTELNPSSQTSALAMLVYTNGSLPYAYFIPASLLTSPMPSSVDVNNTQITGASCANNWACGTSNLSGISSNILSIIGNCNISVTNNGYQLQPNLSTDNHGIVAVQTQMPTSQL